jgi:regulator of sigma D
MGYEIPLAPRQATTKQLRIYWDKGSNNDTEYFTKHHLSKYHLMMHSKYILKDNLIRIVRQSYKAAECEGVFLPIPTEEL